MVKSGIALGFVIGGIMGNCFFASFTYAKRQPASFSPESGKYLYLDQIEEAYFKTLNVKNSQKLAKAQEALNQKKYKKARNLAAPIQSDPLLGDYGYYLVAQAHLAEARFNLSKKYYNHAQSRAEKAIASLNQIIQSHPSSPLLKWNPIRVGQAELIIGQSQVGRKRYSKAKPYFEKGFLRLRSKKSLTSTPLKALQAYIQVCQKSPSTGCSLWNHRLVLSFSKHSSERKALIQAFPNLSKYRERNFAYPRKNKNYQEKSTPDEELFKQAMALYLEDEKSDAYDLFDQMIEKYPDSRDNFRAAYWMGRIQKSKGNIDQARKLFGSVLRGASTGYYGILASYELATRAESQVDASVPNSLLHSPAVKPKHFLSLRRAELLIQGKALDLAAIELDQQFVDQKYPNPFLFYIAYLQSTAGNHLRAFRMIGELIQRREERISTSWGLRIVFPTPPQVVELVEEFSAERQLDPILVLSLIKQESAFQTLATSHAGALGLMQLMPMTAIDTDPEVEQAQIPVPRTNVRIGTQYLSQLISRFEGNLVLALAGYNAGPTRAKRWIGKANPKWTPEEFIESIPFEETRGYVSSIIRNYYWYSYLLQGNLMNNLDYFWGIKRIQAQGTLVQNQEEEGTTNPRTPGRYRLNRKITNDDSPDASPSPEGSPSWQ